MITAVLRNNHILVRNAVEIMKNSSISNLEKEAAEAVKSCSISTLNEEVTFTFDEQVTEISEIDKSFNFHHLQKLETENSEQRIFLIHDK